MKTRVRRKCGGNVGEVWEGRIDFGGGRWGMKSGWEGKGGLKVAKRDGIGVLVELMEKEAGKLSRNGDERFK